MEMLTEVMSIMLLNKESSAGALDHFDEAAELPHPDSLKRSARKRQQKAERKQVKVYEN